MARASLKLASATATPPKRTPEREALVTARAELDECIAEKRELDAALLALRSTRFRAEDEITKAQGDRERAKTASAIARARASVQNAEDELQAAVRTKAELDARRTELTLTLSIKEIRFERALAAVVRSDPATVGLLHEFDEAKARFLELYQALECLGSEMIAETHKSKFFVAGNRLSLFAILEPRGKSPSPLASQWKSALAALASDSDALLPE